MKCGRIGNVERKTSSVCAEAPVRSSIDVGKAAENSNCPRRTRGVVPVAAELPVAEQTAKQRRIGKPPLVVTGGKINHIVNGQTVGLIEARQAARAATVVIRVLRRIASVHRIGGALVDGFR